MMVLLACQVMLSCTETWLSWCKEDPVYNLVDSGKPCLSCSETTRENILKLIWNLHWKEHVTVQAGCEVTKLAMVSKVCGNIVVTYMVDLLIRLRLRYFAEHGTVRAMD